MTIQEVLLQPDSTILKSGAMMLIVAREWKRITGGEPSVCDCQFKNYLRTVRNEHKTLDFCRSTGNKTD